MDITGLQPSILPLAQMQEQNSLKSRGNGADKDPAAAKKVAREFEAMFVGMMMKSMRDTVGKDKLTGGGRGEETFRSLLDQEYANSAAASGQMGLASMIEKQLVKRPASVKGVPIAD